MKVVRNLYQYVNILSLDVAAGAVICAQFFGRIFQVTVSPYALATLALTVWAIYTADHLRDARAIRTVAATDRHRFHQKHFTAILILLLFAIAIDLFLVRLVPTNIVVPGCFLGSVVATYLVLQRSLKFLKEFFVALLYTAGVLLPSIALIAWDFSLIYWILIGKFFITALMNLLLFSLFDYKKDRHQQQHSFVTWFGPASTRKGILLLGTLNILLGIFLWSFDPAVALIFIFMNVMLLSILIFQRHLVSDNRYRMLGDAVFFLPIFYLL